MLAAPRLASALACLGVVALVFSSTKSSPTVLNSWPPQKVLPIDGDYPGGRTGIGIDTYPEYLGLDTAHGVTPYFGDPSVVTNPNALDFPGGFARRSRMTGLRQMALAEDEAAEGEAAEGGEEGEQAASGPSRRAGGIYSYGPYSEVPVSTRPDAACYRCIQQAKSDDWQLYSACSGVCEVADCVATCEERNTGGQFGPDVPVFVSTMCMGKCHV